MMKKKLSYTFFLISMIILSSCNFTTNRTPDSNEIGNSVSEIQAVEISGEKKNDFEKDLLKFEINNITFSIELNDNETVKELLKTLPKSFEMSDLNNNEKYYDLPNPISSNPQNIGQIESGDVLLFGNNTLVIFYESFNTSYSYTRIGRIVNDGDLAKIAEEQSVLVDVQ